MRMKPDDLRPELRRPEAKVVAVAFLSLIAWRTRMVAEMRESMGERSLTILDANILLHVFTFGLLGGPGTRAQEIINTLGAPRRTVRDSLALLVRLDLITQEGGLYYPTAATARIFNGDFEDRYRLIARVCDAFADYQRSVGRDTP